MSMTSELLSNISCAITPSGIPQEVEILARGGRRSSHFFFFGSGGGILFLALPLFLAGRYLMRNPDKARHYKQRLGTAFQALTSNDAAGGTAQSADRFASPSPAAGPNMGRPPRIALGPRSQAGSPSPASQANLSAQTPANVAPSSAPRINLTAPDCSQQPGHREH